MQTLEGENMFVLYKTTPPCFLKRSRYSSLHVSENRIQPSNLNCTKFISLISKSISLKLICENSNLYNCEGLNRELNKSALKKFICNKYEEIKVLFLRMTPSK